MTVAINKMAAGFNEVAPIGPTVSAGYAKALFDLATSKGADPRLLRARSGLTEADLADADARLPFARFKALMRSAKTLCGEPALALHFGARSPFQRMSIVGLAAYAAGDMTEALAQLNRYGRLVIEVEGLGREDRFVIVRRGDGTWLEDRRRNPDDFPELTESTWARFVCEHAHFHPDRPYVKAVHVTQPEPSYRDDYERILRAPVTFGSDRNALLVDDDWPSRRTGQSNRYVFGVFAEKAQALLKSLEGVETLAGKVEAAVIPILHTGRLGMDAVATRLGMSRPTLYRRLAAEGVRYEDLLDDLRCRMARHYLESQKVTLAETAYLTGFSDVSAFSRAFKRWTGARPGELRASRRIA